MTNEAKPETTFWSPVWQRWVGGAIVGGILVIGIIVIAATASQGPAPIKSGPGVEVTPDGLPVAVPQPVAPLE